MDSSKNTPSRPVSSSTKNLQLRWGFTNDNRLKPNKKSTSPGGKMSVEDILNLNLAIPGCPIGFVRING